jgi:hypothetical protein
MNKLLLSVSLSNKLRKRLNGKAITLTLTGVAGGGWQIGAGEAVSNLKMEALDFNIFVSGRFSYEEAMERASLSGDTSIIKNVFRNFLILY